MKGWLENRKMIYGILAVLLFCLLFCLTFRGRAEGLERQQVQIVTFGDSVFGETRDDTAVPAKLQAILGQSVYNAAMGGTCVARTLAERRMDYAKSSLSVVGLSKAVLADDYGVQQSLRVRESNTEYFEEVIDGLERVDFSRVRTIVIQGGINDYHAGTLIEDPEDPYNEYTFLGAIRIAVNHFRKANPGVRILLVTPTYTWYIFTNLTCEESDQGGGLLEDYVNAEIRVAEELGIEVVDVYHDFFPHEKWEDKDLYTRDGLHPNEKGREMLAQRIAEVLREDGAGQG